MCQKWLFTLGQLCRYAARQLDAAATAATSMAAGPTSSSSSNPNAAQQTLPPVSSRQCLSLFMAYFSL
ncbi:hypothetical protein HaLaN_10434, partial [Haematococcus lacustris]